MPCSTSRLWRTFSTNFLEKAIDSALFWNQNRGEAHGCKSFSNRFLRALTEQVALCVAAKIISNPERLTSVLLLFRRRITCWSPSENVTSDHVSLVLVKVLACASVDVHVNSPIWRKPAQATLNAVSIFNSSIETGGVDVSFWRMSLVIGKRSLFVWGKR